MNYKTLHILGKDALGRQQNLLANCDVVYVAKANEVHQGIDKLFDSKLQETFSTCGYDLDTTEYVVDSLSQGCTCIIDSLYDLIMELTDNCTQDILFSIARCQDQVMLVLSTDPNLRGIATKKHMDCIVFVIRNCNQEQVDAMNNLYYIDNNINNDSCIGECNKSVDAISSFLQNAEWDDYTSWYRDYTHWLMVTYYLIITKKDGE